MSSLSLYRKWRPQTFADLRGQDIIRDTLVYALTNDQMSHAYLFCGPRGTGKTTTARLVAKLLNCTAKSGQKPCNQCEPCQTITAGSNLDVIELDAASNRGIDEIRQLRETVRFAPTSARYKVFIIDEVHMLTREAFNALLKTLEEPPTHVVFILATTEAHKVPATIISRSQRFDFRPATVEFLSDHLARVAKAEKINLSPDAAQFLAQLAEGSFRDALSLLDQARSADYSEYTQESIEKLFGFIPKKQVEAVLAAILTGQAKEAHTLLDAALAQGADVRALGNQLLSLSQEILEAAVLDEPTPKRGTTGVKSIIEWIELLADALMDMKACPIPRLPLDLAIAKFAGLTTGDNAPSPIPPEKVADTLKGSEHTDGIESEPEKMTPDPDPTPVSRPSSSVPVVSGLPEHISPADWGKILAAVKTETPSLLTSLAHARVLKVEHDVITLAVPYKMHADKINVPKNREVVETEVSQVLGVPMKIHAEVNKEAAKPDDLVDVAEVFELEF